MKRARKKARSKALQEGEGSHLKDLYRICLANMTPVIAPIALISQIQRSGGTMLSQLFDGHPEVYAHPDELNIGYPKKYIWPRIDLVDSPEQWFEILFEDSVIDHFQKGYEKGNKPAKIYPFIFLPPLQKKIFSAHIASVESVTLREVFNAYMTSYFGAWLDHQSNDGTKKIITGFTPRLSMQEENMQCFFEIYPDGRLISIVRDPRNWLPSAQRHGSNKYREDKAALRQWNESALAMIRNNEMYKGSVTIIRFEDLISKTEPAMRYLAEFLHIDFDDILLKPTFNKWTIGANTSFNAEKSSIVNSTLSRYKTLTREQLNIIDEITGAVYQQVLNVAVAIE